MRRDDKKTKKTLLLSAPPEQEFPPTTTQKRTRFARHSRTGPRNAMHGESIVRDTILALGPALWATFRSTRRLRET